MIDSEVKAAARVILSGGVLLYPTDTIWGIGCDATKPDAVRKIYEIKQREDNRSMLVLVPGVEMLGSFVESIPEKALELISNTTRPTTIIYPEAINQLPMLNQLFGALFFLVLIVAGISSMISLTEAFSCSICDKFSISRK